MEMWNFVLSCLVILHLVTEYIHYFLEYFWGKKEKNILGDIQRHRMNSTKTKRLMQLQKDVNEIKQLLKQKENFRPKERQDGTS